MGLGDPHLARRLAGLDPPKRCGRILMIERAWGEPPSQPSPGVPGEGVIPIGSFHWVNSNGSSRWVVDAVCVRLCMDCVWLRELALSSGRGFHQLAAFCSQAPSPNLSWRERSRMPLGTRFVYGLCTLGCDCACRRASVKHRVGEGAATGVLHIVTRRRRRVGGGSSLCRA
jgi:hypothetical protein